MATSSSPVTTATNTAAKGTVVFVQGEAYLRDSSGKLSAIKPGDVVTEGQEIVTHTGAVVEMQLPGGAKVSVGPDRELLLNEEFFATATPERSDNAISSLGTEADKVIQALNAGKDPFEDLEDPAAGLTGGGVGDQTHDFVRLVRVLEEVTPVSYSYASTADGVEFLPAATLTTQTINTPPVANDDRVNGTEDQPLIVDVLANDSDADDDPLVVTNATATNGQVTINPDGSLRYVPNPDFNGPDTVTYTISDGKGGTSTATVTINVVAVNDAPVALPDAATTPEDQPVTINVLGNNSDPDGDPLSVTSATVDPALGSVVINPDGTLTFTPTPDFNGPVLITYTVSDGKGGTASSTVTVNVTPVNDNPIANPDVATTLENTPVTVPVLGNDSDPEGDPLTVTSATVNPALGSVAINPDGTLTFTPAPNFNGPVVINYTISDGQGGTATSTVTVNVTPDNTAPVANPDSATTLEDQPITVNVLGNDSDPDGDPLSVTGATVDPAKGTVSVNPDGTLTFTPAANINGPVVVTYTIADGNGGTATSTVTIDVTPQNDAPVATPDTATTLEDQPVTVNVLGNDTDPDGDPLSVTGATVDPAKGTVAVNPDGSLTFNPAANINGPVVVTYTISDGNGGTATSTVTIDVTPVNDNATISAGTGTTKEDTVLLASGTLTITDPDTGEAAFQAQTGVTGTYGSFSIDETGHWAFTLDNGNPLVQNLADGDSRTESFTVRSVDGTESTVVITILGTNETIGSPGVGIVKEDNTLSTGGSLNASGGASFVAQPATPGTYGSFTLNTDGSWNYVLNNPASVVQSLGEGQTRSETFPVTLSDGTASTVTITVVGTNDPALIGPGSGSVTEDSILSTGGTLSITDVDAGEASFRPQTSVAGTYGSFSLDAAGNWTYTLNNAHPDVQALGVGDTLSETFPVLSTDGSTSNVFITINGTNDGPVATPDTTTTPEDQPITVNVLGNDTDPDGDPLSVTGATVDPAKGTVAVNPDGTLTFNPAANFNGPVVVTYTISDGKGGTATSTVTIDVTPVNDAPVALDDVNSLSKTATTPATGNVITNPAGLDTDLDGDTLTVSLVGSAPVSGATVVNGAFGTLTIHPDGSYSYIQDTANSSVSSLAPGATLTDSFSYTVSDGKGGTATAELRITIAGLNTPPIAAPDSATTNEDEPVRIAVLGNDSDPEGDTLSITSATVDPAKGNVVVNADGTLTFNPAANFNGPVVVTYTISDGKGGTATSTVNINVNPVNDAPVANPNTATTPEDQPVTVNVLGNDTDPEGDTLSVTGATVDPAKGTVAVNPDGTLTFNPAANFNGPVVVTYTISDGNGGTASSTVTINVTPVNDAPVAVNDTATTTEDNPVSRTAATGVLANDSDIDSTGLTVSGVRTGTNGAFTAPGASGVTLTGTYGTLLIHADGSYTYTPGAAAQALNAGDSVQDVFSYQLSDGSLTATANLSITVIGANDPAVITGNTAGTVKEDTAGQLTATGTLTATDVDSPATFTPASAAGTFGSFAIAANGTWTYTLNNSAANVQALKEGDTRTENFTVTTADGTTRNVVVTVLGTNEIPTVANVTATGAEDPSAPIPVVLAGNDVDGTVTSLTLADLPANGTLYRDAAMTQPVTAGTPLATTGGAVTLYFQPGANWNGETSFHFTAADNNGGISSQATASINVTPVNDPPVAIADTGSTNQDTALVRNAAGGVLTNDSDIDGGALGVTGIAAGSGSSVPVTAGGTSVSGAFGTLLIAQDGSYTYTPGDSAKALTLGQSASDVFTYTVSDGNGGTATTTLTIQVNGLNDAPVIGGVATGNVTEDGTLTAGGTLTISDPDAGQSSFVPQTLTGTYGTLTLQSSGSWSYSLNNAATNVQSLKQGEVVQDNFSVHSADGTAKTVTINVTGTNDAPVVGTATVSVSEEGLAGGIADTTGANDTTNQTTASGTISVSDVDGNALSVTLTAPTAALSSNGVAITWTGSGTQTLVGSAGGVEIIRATIANDGTQSVKLSGPIDHPDTTQEDVLTLNLGVNVNDGVTTTTSTLVVRVEDDAPKASNVNQSVVIAPQDTNLLIVLDNSGSMNTADGVDGTTRLKSAITALTQLIDTYDALGEVRIRIVTFNSSATSVGTAWTTVDLGKTQLGNVTLGGTTNFDSAIAAAQSAYGSTGKLASGQNVAYFLSDGVPNSGTEIGTADETAWKAFLTANGITSYALGMGAGASQGPLNPIAYDGLTKTDLNASVITDFAQLSNALHATIPQSASGDILSGGLLGGTSGFGGDGGHISSITIEGVTYTYNPTGATSVTQSGGTGNGTYNATTHLLTVRTDDGGTLVVNMSTGSYNYTPRASVTTPIVDGFDFVLADKDGDTASASVTFNVSRQAEQVVTLTSTSTVIESSRLGLTGEYYGYNETTGGVTRTHADDTTLGNLDHVSDMTTIVDGRSGQTVVGTYNAAPATGSDATFSADKIDYGFGYTTGSTTASAVNGNLGNNPTVGADMAVNSGALYNFLRGGTTGSDASTLTTTTGLGNTTDSGLRFVGMMNVAGGIYDIRVTADDGFRINIGGQTVAMFDNIQSPTARTYTGISMESGLQPIEILYWEQGGNARLRIEVKLSSEADSAYKTLGTDEFALFTPTSAPVLNDLQDIVESSTNGSWLVRTGERLDGTDGNDHITGSDGQDIIYGGAGNDTIIGGSGASLISGGSGNDTLTGGLGSDTFKWSLGDAGSAGAPAIDAITDFNKAAAISGGDVLDLGDLLQGESHTGTNPGNLGSYLHFEKSGVDTVVHISSTGGYTGGTFSAGATDQKIVLQGVDLTNSGALSTDAQIIQDLLTKGKLSAD